MNINKLYENELATKKNNALGFKSVDRNNKMNYTDLIALLVKLNIQYEISHQDKYTTVYIDNLVIDFKLSGKSIGCYKRMV